MLMKTGGCRSQRPAPPTFCTSLMMLITVYTDDDDDDNDNADDDDDDDVDVDEDDVDHLAVPNQLLHCLPETQQLLASFLLPWDVQRCNHSFIHN